MVRPDGRTLSLASSDTILLTGRALSGAAQWDAGTATPVDSNVIIKDALLLADGSIAACGQIGDFRGGLFLHLDTLGNVLSARRYQHNNSTSLSSLVLLPNGNLRLYGNTQVTFSMTDACALDIDGNGDLLDARRWSIGGLYQVPSEMIATADGGQALIGGAWQMSGGSPVWKSAVITKLDSTGHVQWAWRVAQAGQKTFPEGIVQLADGRLIYWIRAEYQFGSKPVLIGFAPDGTPGMMIQLDAAPPSDGWLSSGGTSERTLSMQGDTALVMTGFGNLTDSLYFMRVDTALTNATMLFQGRLPGEWPEELITLPDGAFLRTAYATSPFGGHGLALAYLNNAGESACGDQVVPVTISVPALVFSSSFVEDTIGTLVSDVSALFGPAAMSCVDLAQCLPTALEQDQTADALVLFPNPATDRITFQGEGIVAMEIMDATGRLVLAHSIAPTSEVTLDIRSLNSGFFHLRVFTAGGWHTSSLMKQ